MKNKRASSKHDYKRLIRKGQKENNRLIRLTKRPIFNLWRLVKEPCVREECHHSYHKGENKIDVWVFMTALLVIVGPPILNASGLGWYPAYSIVSVVTAFLLVHTANNPSWSDHSEELEEKRKSLLAKTEGDFLYASLEQIILQTKERLFGDKSEFKRWTEMLEGRGKEIGEPTESVTDANDIAGYRISAQVTHVRIVPENFFFTRALTDHRAFAKNAEEKIAALLKRAGALKESVDGLTRIRKIPNAEKSARTEIRTLENVIQAGVDTMIAGLEQLTKETAEQNVASSRASADSYTSEAIRETKEAVAELEKEIPELEEVKQAGK